MEDFAYFDNDDKSIVIETDEVDPNRCIKTVVRECDVY